MSTKANEPEFALATDKPNLEEGASWFSYIFLVYLDDLFATGYKKTLSMRDLGNVAESDKSDVLHKEFCIHWRKAMATPAKPGKKRELWPILWSTVGRWRLYLALFLFALSAALQFGPVMILKVLVEYLQGTRDMDLSLVWVLVALLFVFPLVSSILLAHSNTIMAHVGCQLRNVLIGVIYRKSLTLSSSSRQSVSTGRIVTMFSEDTNQIRMFVYLLANTIVAPLQIAVCLYLLYEQVGVATFVGLGYILVTTPINGVLFGFVNRMRKGKMKFTDERVKLINEVLSGIRIIKYYAWEKAFIANISHIRDEELKILEAMGYLFGAAFALLMLGATQIQTILIFFTYVSRGGQLDAAKAFTTLTLFGQMTSPFIFLPYGLQQYMMSRVSTGRIMEFLLTEDLEVYIKHHDKLSGNNANNANNNTEGGEARRASENVIEVEKATMSWMSAEEIEASKKSTEADAKASAETPIDGDAAKEKVEAAGDVELTPAKTGTYSAVANAEAAAPDDKEAVVSKEEKKESRVYHTLQDVSFKVKEGALVAVVGPVGCGKSSLLSAVLGEMCCLSGTVSMYDGLQVAFCDQRPWIVNATVKDNILFGLPYDETRFNAAIYASCMTDDLKIFTNGINTEIGERGINMSGGQKARVALARAVYSNADLYLLDDPLSAVDAHVGQHIFQKCVREALHGKTRILVTHHVNVLPMCDQIIILEDGRVKMSGTYDEIMRSGIDIEKYVPGAEDEEAAEEAVEVGSDVVRRASSDGVAALKDESMGKERSTSDSDSRIRSSSLSSSRDRAGSRGRARTRTTSGDAKTAKEEKGDGKLMSVEEQAEGDVKLSTYLSLVRRGGTLVFCGVIFFTFAGQVLGINANFWLIEWGTETTEDHQDGQDMSKSRNMFYLNSYAAMLLSVIGLMALTRIVLNYHRHRMSQSYHHLLLNKVLKAPVAFFDVTPIGRIINRFSQDMAVIDELLAHSISQAINVGGTCVGCIGAIIGASKGTFIALIFPLLYIYTIFQNYYRASNTAIARIEAVTRSPIYADFSQVLGGTSTIRAYKQQKRYVEQLETYSNTNTVPGVYQQIASQWLAIRLDFISSIITLFMGVLAIASKSSNFIPAGNLGLGLSYAITLTGLLKFAVRVIAGTEAQMNSVERFDYYIETVEIEGEEKKGDKNDGAAATGSGKGDYSAIKNADSTASGTDGAAVATSDVELAEAGGPKLSDRVPRVPIVEPPADWPSVGKVEFENVSMRYREGPLVLKNVSFVIEGDEKIGFCGRTGCGKSSLMVALFRIEELVTGRILIDGLDVASVPLNVLRSKLCIIPQDPVMFSATVRFNLDPFSNYSDSDLWDTLDSVDMKGYVSSLPKKLEELVSEGGENFSAGQRQLICMARALLRKPKILVMDEATASIDMETDALVQQMVRDKFKHCTVLTIAHRLDTIYDSDKIAVMSAGKMVEYGPAATLLTAPISEAGGVGTFKLLWTRHQQENASSSTAHSPAPKK